MYPISSIQSDQTNQLKHNLSNGWLTCRRVQRHFRRPRLPWWVQGRAGRGCWAWVCSVSGVRPSTRVVSGVAGMAGCCTGPSSPAPDSDTEETQCQRSETCDMNSVSEIWNMRHELSVRDLKHAIWTQCQRSETCDMNSVSEIWNMRHELSVRDLKHATWTQCQRSETCDMNSVSEIWNMRHELSVRDLKHATWTQSQRYETCDMWLNSGTFIWW